MGWFKMDKPRPFHHEYIYYDERKEKLKKIEENAKRELGMLPPKEFNPEDIRGYPKSQKSILIPQPSQVFDIQICSPLVSAVLHEQNSQHTMRPKPTR